MDKSQAIHAFWASFGLNAYDENTVSETAEMPYITYSVAADSMDNIILLTGSLWYRSTSWESISKKADEISDDVTYGGKLLKLNKGYLYLSRGTPFYQRMSDEDPDVRRIYFNLNAEYLTD